MSDRGYLFLFSVLMIVAALGATVWLVVTGQALTVDGLFLMLAALLTALVFLLYVIFLLRRAMEPPAKPVAAKAPAAQAAAPATVAKTT
jgi:lipopolysaccharide export LptBFGC system permease protein LptF